MTVTASPPGTDLRDQLSSLRALLVLAMVMAKTSDEDQILHVVATTVPSLAHCRLEGAYVDGGWKVKAPSSTGALSCLEDQLRERGWLGGALPVPSGWAWAYLLRVSGEGPGYLVVSAACPPAEIEQFFLRTLAQQTAVALASARLHQRDQATAEELRQANLALEATVHALRRNREIHDRLNRVAVAGEGQDGIARALHELTGCPVAIEDRYGNLRAWAGPSRPDPYPKDPPARREQMLRRAMREGRPIREGERVLALAQPRDDILGVLALVDADGRAGEEELAALEHGATVLAMELARIRSLAEGELRLRRDLVEDLLAGTDEESAVSRAQALGYDLERPHRVLVVEGRGRCRDEESFFQGVRRAVRDREVGSLLVARGGTVVVLAGRDDDWAALRAGILSELGGGRCRVGIGGVSCRPSDVPRSYREAVLALRIQSSALARDQVTCFDDLGVYRIFCRLDDLADVERLVHDWLGPLLDYDRLKGSELATTISEYVECGGNWDDTAAALCVHRSTLKYRLQRIRELTGYDLGEADTHFNLQLASRAWRILQALRSDGDDQDHTGSGKPPG